MGHDPTDAADPATGMATVLYTGIERVAAVTTDPVLPTLLPGRFAPNLENFVKAEARLLELGIREHRATAKR